MSIVAIPSKEINPIISVIVVNMTPPAIAGSIFNFLRISGSVTPLIAPIIRLTSKATATTKAKKTLSNHK